MIVCRDHRERRVGVKEPKYLFDRLEYVSIGGGTVQIGANIDASHWPSGSGPLYTFDEYEKAVNTMMRAYNPAWYDPPDRYGDAVVKKSRDCPPAQPTVVFR